MRYNNLPEVKDNNADAFYHNIPTQGHLPMFRLSPNPVPVILGFSRGAHWGQTFALT